MLETIIALISQALSFATKLTPDDKNRDTTQTINLPRLEANAYIKIYDKEYIRLRNHTEIDIAQDVDFVTRHSMPADQEKELIDMLTARINAYRERHPIIFNKWLQKQKATQNK